MKTFWWPLVGSLLVGPATYAAQPSDAFIKDDDIVVKKFEEMAYPPVARAAAVRGAVVVKVDLDERGAVTNVQVLSGAPLLAPSAAANVKTWMFEPRPPRAAVIVYLFDIDGGCNGLHSFFRISPPNVVRVSTCTNWAQ